eukprot:GHVU01001352.1.p1 GENE.GHVU01001352.1~~GHVU01001352.1.p1  ORF type:complete len:153 (-),score=6.11 GHVU01001352.1:54-512(-)
MLCLSGLSERRRALGKPSTACWAQGGPRTPSRPWCLPFAIRQQLAAPPQSVSRNPSTSPPPTGRPDDWDDDRVCDKHNPGPRAGVGAIVDMQRRQTPEPPPLPCAPFLHAATSADAHSVRRLRRMPPTSVAPTYEQQRESAYNQEYAGQPGW